MFQISRNRPLKMEYMICDTTTWECMSEYAIKELFKQMVVELRDADLRDIALTSLKSTNGDPDCNTAIATAAVVCVVALMVVCGCLAYALVKAVNREHELVANRSPQKEEDENEFGRL